MKKSLTVGVKFMEKVDSCLSDDPFVVSRSRMFAVRSFRSLQFTFSQLGGTQQCLRSLSGSSNVVQKNDDMPLQMENPYKQPQKGCILCNITVDFKNVQLLSQFISPHTGRVYGRHITGLCGKKQREIGKAIKKAHSMGFMSVTHKNPHFMKDPNICDIRHLE
ncbi:small ribosomal subunit protein bS18m isoform X1 [Salmo trutta]|uniref:small ribosomal subunit protein bS18m isoform X1 n=2 Tax=Salmo trutta TaxID=8032 RepID=UPI001131C5C1|nr:28S ribosomal protein S18c, mitochondrial isoform X1 [Salmo trutta]